MTAQNLFREDLGPRRYDLDWVRIVAFLLLILYHVGMYYVTWDWHVKSPDASGTIEPLMMLTSPWRLSLLFLVSGVATAYLLARQGAGRFMGQRSTRLLIPLVFGMLVIVPPQSYLEVVEKLRYAGSFAEFYRLYITGFHGFCRGGDCLIMPTWNHLWFVAYLWVYTAVLYAAVRIAPPAIPWLRRIAEKRLSGLGVLLWPIAYLVAIRLSLAPRFPATHALVGDWYNHAMYFGVFLLGFSLAGARAAWGALERARWFTLGLAIVGWAFVAAYFSAYSDDAAVPPMALRLFQRAVYGAEQWLAIAAVVGFAHRHLTHDSAVRRYLTAAIFPVYILHQTIIVVVAHALKPAHLYPPVEGVLLVLVTAATCFMSYEAIRRVRLLRPLFGLELGAPRAPKIKATNVPVAQRLAPQLSVPQDIN
ncbi:MAG TPA: acyltransferase family protein [Steroidobacteraceae bacterium]|nr:acyltransferase family protein [Steroidobacteraceae bacterium]